jgi:GNAT superfamily N-acetyltransferase
VHARGAGASGVEDLSLLLRELGYPVAPDALVPRFERLIADTSTRLFVAATDDDRVVGLAALHIMQVIQRDELSARLTALVVRADMRGRGIARLLLRTVEQAASDAGCDRLNVNSGEHRTEAHEVYRRLGFSDTGRRFVRPLSRSTSESRP